MDSAAMMASMGRKAKAKAAIRYFVENMMDGLWN
jgi:hypothetical protein